jgi:hypothetical protein
LHPAALLQELLRGFLIRPEVGSGRLRFDPLKLGAFRRNIKETSRVVRLAYLSLHRSFLNPELKSSLSLLTSM